MERQPSNELKKKVSFDSNKEKYNYGENLGQHIFKKQKPLMVLGFRLYLSDWRS
jgi:hypothetical protein